jgi:hypothetical protein
MTAIREWGHPEILPDTRRPLSTLFRDKAAVPTEVAPPPTALPVLPAGAPRRAGGRYRAALWAP